MARKGALVALGICLALTGCMPFGGQRQEREGTESMEDRGVYSIEEMPTERHMQIARDLGRTEAQVAAMEQGWGNSSEWRHIAFAELMLDHLEEKYSEDFRPRWIATPELMEPDYRMEAEAASGPYKGKGVDAKYVWKDVGEPYFEDDYTYYLRHEEYEGYLKEIVSGVYGGTPGGVGVMDVSMTGGPYGDWFTAEGDIREHARRLSGGVDIYFPPECGLGEEEYYALIDRLAEAFEGRGMSVGYRVVFITKLSERPEFGDFSCAQAITSMYEHTEENPTYKWKIHGRTERKEGGQDGP